MTTFAIGDVQGCCASLQSLLEQLPFNPAQDRLWFVGDLVNRGPDSLSVLRFVKSLGDKASCVLGNHDLHLLAVAEGLRQDKHHELHDILAAPDREELLHWLRHRPLLVHDTTLNFTMIHAGLPPQWDLAQAMRCADELQQVLRSEQYHEFLSHMYGDEPRVWSESLKEWDRLRFICNCFTRLRYCDAEGQLALRYKGAPGSQPENVQPWFAHSNRLSLSMRIVFGHWSTLGNYHTDTIFATDTGCIWGGKLTALQLDANPPSYIQIDCPQLHRPGKE